MTSQKLPNPRVTKLLVERDAFFDTNKASKNQQDEWLKARLFTEIANMDVELSSKNQKIADLENELRLAKEKIIKDSAPSNG
jgi:hypothetical protein